MRIVLTGGVTGGHIYPAIAIGDRFKAADPNCEIIYIASGQPLEKEIISKAGYEIFDVQSEPLRRDSIFCIVSTLRKTLKGKSEAKRIMKDFNPDAVISTGSYVSVPVVLAGAGLGAKIYLHEQNGFPGVSNKYLAKYADKVFLGFESAGGYFSNQDNLVYSGNPVRSEFAGRDKTVDRAEYDIPADDFVIMVFGGSLGSETTNKVGESIARKYADNAGTTVIWGTGKSYYDEISKRLDDEGFSPDNVRIMPYIADMPRMLSASDISISRSGALSVAEITMAGKTAVFIPSPNVTEDHQYYNAKAVADAGGAFIVREDGGAEAAADEVLKIIESIEGDRDLLNKMETASRSLAPASATDIIYNTIIEDFPSRLSAAEKEDREKVSEPDDGPQADADNAEPGEEQPVDVGAEPDDEQDAFTEDARADEAATDRAAKTIMIEKAGKEPAAEEASSGESVKPAAAADINADTAFESEPVQEHELSEEDRAIVEKIRVRKIEAAAKNRRLKRRAVTSVVLLFSAIAAFILSLTPLFTVDLIEVKGNTSFSAEEIISMAHAVPGKNLIYHPEKDVIKDNLEKNPYIESAEVSRKLPSTLVITVSERKQMMALKYDDDYLILDREGILLQKSRTKPKLTLLEGNIITKIKLGEQLGTQNEELIKKSVEFMQMMADSDLYYVKVDMSDLDSVEAYVYDTLQIRGDYDTLMKNMENGRIHMVLDKLFEDSIKRGTITFVDDETASFVPSF